MRSAYTDNAMRIRGSTDGFRMVHTAAAAGSFAVATMTHTMAVEHAAQPLGYPLIGRVLAGRFGRDTGSESLTAAPGELFLVAQPDQPYTARWDTVRLQLITAGPAALAGVTGLHPGELPRFTSLRPGSPAAAVHLAGTIDFLTSGVLARPAAASPLVVGGAARLLAATMLAAFPSTWTAGPAGSLADAGTETLRRAVTFIEEHASLDITAADIAAAAHVSVRAVQLAFRRHLATTPMACLRRVRLSRARQELRAASPSQTTVAAVAARWGFYSPSRFSTHYRAAFGELPRDTLRHS
jgi:AraC-like DNA-binding protein